MHGKKCRKAKLSICGFSIASALTSGLTVLVLGLLATHLGIGLPYVTLLGSIYKGYAATAMGSLMGAGWAALVGLVCGFFFSLFYNIIVRACHCCKKGGCACPNCQCCKTE